MPPPLNVSVVLESALNITTIVNTHDMNSVMGIGDKIIFICEGKAEWQGTSADIMSSDNKRLNDFIFASDILRKYKEAEDEGHENRQFLAHTFNRNF